MLRWIPETTISPLISTLETGVKHFAPKFVLTLLDSHLAITLWNYILKGVRSEELPLMVPLMSDHYYHLTHIILSHTSRSRSTVHKDVQSCVEHKSHPPTSHRASTQSLTMDKVERHINAILCTSMVRDSLIVHVLCQKNFLKEQVH